MILGFIVFAMVIVLVIFTATSMIYHINSLPHLKFDITFFAIALISFVTMSHILIKNRKEIMDREVLK